MYHSDFESVPSICFLCEKMNFSYNENEYKMIPFDVKDKNTPENVIKMTETS